MKRIDMLMLTDFPPTTTPTHTNKNFEKIQTPLPHCPQFRACGQVLSIELQRQKRMDSGLEFIFRI